MSAMSTDTRPSRRNPTYNGVLDVSELSAARAQQYAREGDDVYFERKGGRTFLVTR